METQIKVFGLNAKSIMPGDLFSPAFDSEEGHDLVTLTKDNTVRNLLEKYDASDISLDGLVTGLRGLVDNNE